MADSFLNLPAKLQVAVYEYIIGGCDRTLDLDDIASLRLCCRQIQRSIDHEFLKVYWKYINAFDAFDDLPGLILERPATVGEAQILRMTLSIEHATQYDKVLRVALQNFIRRLPDFVDELKVNVVPPKNATASAAKVCSCPDWQHLIDHYDTTSSALSDPELYQGYLTRIEIHWRRRCQPIHYIKPSSYNSNKVGLFGPTEGLPQTRHNPTAFPSHPISLSPPTRIWRTQSVFASIFAPT